MYGIPPCRSTYRRELMALGRSRYRTHGEARVYTHAALLGITAPYTFSKPVGLC